MPFESAGCCPNREEASEKEEGEEEMERGKRPRTVEDSGGDVEEFLVLLEKIEAMKKHWKKKRMLMSMQQQRQIRSDVASLTPNKSSSSSWKPSFQWEDFNINPSLSVETDFGCAATAEKNDINNAAVVLMTCTDRNQKRYGEGEISIQIGHDHLKTKDFLETPAECSHDHANDLNKKEAENVDAPPDLELRLFTI